MIDCSKLLPLQEFDLKIDAAQEAIEAQHRRVAKFEEEVAKEEALLQRKEALFKKIQLRSRKTDTEFNEVNEKIHVTKMRLEAASTSPSVYGALEREMVTLREQSSKLETEILEDMEKIETLEKDLSKSAKVCAGRKLQQDEIKAQAQREIARLRAEIDIYKTERGQLSLAIPGPDLGLYEELRRKKKGRIIWEIDSRGCPACGMGLPAGFVNSLAAGPDGDQCEYCEVLLLWNGLRDGVIA